MLGRIVMIWWIIGGFATVGLLWVVAVLVSVIYIFWKLFTNPDG